VFTREGSSKTGLCHTSGGHMPVSHRCCPGFDPSSSHVRFVVGRSGNGAGYFPSSLVSPDISHCNDCSAFTDRRRMHWNRHDNNKFKHKVDGETCAPGSLPSGVRSLVRSEASVVPPGIRNMVRTPSRA
jgi:hypothetical protein